MTQSVSLELEQPKPSLVDVNSAEEIKGLLIAGSILTAWAFSLFCLLSIELTHFPVWAIALAWLWQTFLYTGLFITAHDAMHGAVCPTHPKLNNLIGSLALLFYGLFSYQALLRKHWLHHKHPATELDPDFHDENHVGFFAWYFQFMMRYWSWSRMWGLVVLFHGMHYLFHVSYINLVLFWVIPSIASSMQLFFFGTFLTHREPEGGYTHSHRAQSTAFPLFWSFITCYHFGYHREHHEFPHLPWWKLPAAHKVNF